MKQKQKLGRKLSNASIERRARPKKKKIGVGGNAVAALAKLGKN